MILFSSTVAALFSASTALVSQDPAAWLSAQVDRAMSGPADLGEKRAIPLGVVTVTFRIDEDRRPEAVRVEKSANPHVRSLALRVIDTLPDFPANFPNGSHAVVLRWDRQVAQEEFGLASQQRRDLAAIADRLGRKEPVELANNSPAFEVRP